MIYAAIAFAIGVSSWQDKSTRAETSLPKEFVEAVQFLVGHGFANPKGGRFSVATINLSATWNGGLRPTKVRGWILPAKPGKAETIVLPNGLAYPVLSVVRGADVNEGLEPILDANQYQVRGMHDLGYTGIACLLLTGNTSLAEKAYRKNEQRYSFLNLANEYLVNRYHRAAEAHMRGDDQLASEDAKAIKQDQADYENEAKRVFGTKYFEERARPDLGGNGIPTAFRYLDQIDALTTDSERRLKQTKARPTLKDVLQLPKIERLPKLIELLDGVSARQMSQPGGVDILADPIVAALVELGNSAGPALLDTIEHDQRLTRSVSFGRDFGADRNLITVARAALSALKGIAQVDQLQEYGTPLDIKKVREYWAKYGSMTPQERWYNMLADDSLASRQWIEAANKIVDRTEIVNLGGMRGYRNDPTKPMHGESLRNLKNPSVSDLMAMRARMLFKHAKQINSSNAGYPMDMGLFLQKWDPKAALPVLQDVSREIIAYAIKNKSNSIFNYEGNRIAEVFDVRLKSGDSEAFTEYSEFLLKMNHGHLSNENSIGLKLLAKYSAQPEMSEAVQRLFVDPSSKWNLQNAHGNAENEVAVQQLVASPLIILAPFREYAKVLLADKTQVGTSWNDGRQLHTRTYRGGETTWGIEPGKVDALHPILGEIRSIRMCDEIAKRLSAIKAAPKFEVFWPEAERDHKIEEILKLLDTLRYEDVKSLPV